MASRTQQYEILVCASFGTGQSLGGSRAIVAGGEDVRHLADVDMVLILVAKQGLEAARILAIATRIREQPQPRSVGR
jgi:hypothetical protein